MKISEFAEKYGLKTKWTCWQTNTVFSDTTAFIEICKRIELIEESIENLNRDKRLEGSEVGEKSKNSKRFICNGDGTVTDSLTALTWIKDPSELGKEWGTPGNPSRMNHHDAVRNCKELSFAGHKDWRLPAIKELQSIIDYERRGPTINTEFFPNTQSSWYWSGTPVAGCSYGIWIMDFGYGDVNGSGMRIYNYVRPVRASQ